ncbi:UNVERIFIED_CONTAM: hypothetical protein GTU68_056877 [Idotea baltica]|nr:hypothetical protein [Idotea baltica]
MRVNSRMANDLRIVVLLANQSQFRSKKSSMAGKRESKA